MLTRSEQILRRFLLVSALALTLPVGSAIAQTPMMGDGGGRRVGGHEMGDDMRHEHAVMFRKLDLSADQQKQLRLLRDAQQDTTRPLMRSLREERIALQALAASDQYDAKKAGDMSEKIGRLHGQLALAMAEGHRKMLAILTPEQRAKIKDFPHTAR